MIIRLNDDAELEIVIKGDIISKSIGFCDWGSCKIPESGINTSIGHRGERGAFLPNSLLNKLIREIRKKEKEIKND